ncbi:FMN-binding glutamate synthase family protein [Oceanobacillus salinisoli]|uniref:FMN-binding glutamate synthase family protein n=1 Tax=Oceanobacillus salinisoli TaxID=2678611 RepID=UPI001E479927|nr:FMN-binding glutamate synthase family protein [Oceanobacillus salinisoli]
MDQQHTKQSNSEKKQGNPLNQPTSSSKKWPHFDELTFIPAQVSTFPIDSEETVDIQVTIGQQAKKPLKVDIPILIGGLAYGLSLDKQTRLTIAEAAKQTGTALNSGEGGILQEEIDAAGKYILQFSKTDWAKEEQLIKQADMIEIKLGQGGSAGMGATISSDRLTENAKQSMDLNGTENAVIYEHFFENQSTNDIKEMIKELRNLSKGVPIGVKIGAGGNLEQDIDELIGMGVDAIAIDGGQAATYGAPSILMDDFGIPTLHAVVRASNHLERKQLKGEISLIVSGGLFTAGEFLKALALGADAVYVGSAILQAMEEKKKNETSSESNKDNSNNESDGAKNKDNSNNESQNASNQDKSNNESEKKGKGNAAADFLTSAVEEIETGIRAMGKRSLNEVSKKDMVSYDEVTAKMVGIPYSFEPLKNKKNEVQQNPDNQGGPLLNGEVINGQSEIGQVQAKQSPLEQGNQSTAEKTNRRRRRARRRRQSQQTSNQTQENPNDLSSS